MFNICCGPCSTEIMSKVNTEIFWQIYGYFKCVDSVRHIGQGRLVSRWHYIGLLLERNDMNVFST